VTARRTEQIGESILYLGDCLGIIPGLEPFDAVFADPPYSSGGAFRGDRMLPTSAKYQSSENRGIYAEFSGDNRDQRAYGYWSALWIGACQSRMAPRGSVVRASLQISAPTTNDDGRASGRRIRVARNRALGQNRRGAAAKGAIPQPVRISGLGKQRPDARRWRMRSRLLPIFRRQRTQTAHCRKANCAIG